MLLPPWILNWKSLSHTVDIYLFTKTSKRWLPRARLCKGLQIVFSFGCEKKGLEGEVRDKGLTDYRGVELRDYKKE